MYGISLDRSSNVPLTRQLSDALRASIRGGTPGPGAALPSTRDMAAALGLSRGTVGVAYEMLLAEGYLVSRQGAPTRVADGIADPKAPMRDGAGMGAGVPTAAAADRRKVDGGPPLLDLGTGRPALDRFPLSVWNRCAEAGMRSLSVSSLGYGDPAGLPELRREIAGWLLRRRGVAVDPADLFITSGSTHALSLLMRTLAGDPRAVAVEDSCHRGMRRVLDAQQADILPVPVDEAGIRTDWMQARIGEDGGRLQIKAAYVTPSHQFPLGGILPAPRRAALVKLACSGDFLVVEDDYDSEFRYAGQPVSPLWSLAPDRVAYVGTFSKTLFPAIRVGYVLLPERIRARFLHLRRHDDVQSPPLEQAALCRFIQTGALDLHLRRMTALYAQRRKRLVECLRAEMGDAVRILGDASGLHLVLQLEGRPVGRLFSQACRREGLLLATAEDHRVRLRDTACTAASSGGSGERWLHDDKLVIGYGHLDDGGMRAAVTLLARLANRWNGRM